MTDCSFGQRTSGLLPWAAIPTQFASPATQTNHVSFLESLMSTSSANLYTAAPAVVGPLIIFAVLAYVGGIKWGERRSIKRHETTRETELETIKRILGSNPTPEIVTLLETTLEPVIIKRLEREQQPEVIQRLEDENFVQVRRSLRKRHQQEVIDELKELERPAVRASLDESERRRLISHGRTLALNSNYRMGIERGRRQMLEDARQAVLITRRLGTESDDD